MDKTVIQLVDQGLELIKIFESEVMEIESDNQ